MEARPVWVEMAVVGDSHYREDGQICRGRIVRNILVGNILRPGSF